LEEAKESVVDYKFHACIKNPKGDLEAYVKKMLELGMTSVKLFTTYSDSGRRTDDPEIKALLRLSEKYGFLVTAHIENDDMIRHDPQFTYRDLTTSRPSSAETTEALKLAGFVGECGGTLYMVHCSSGNTLAALKKQYPHLLNRKLFVESCPHYFLFTSDKLQGADGSLYTMAPPLRSESERQKLIELFPELTAIGTDHCPFLTEEKQQKSLDLMPLGIGGIEQAFSVLYPHFGNSLISRMTDKTARIHRINPKKGSIAAGADADFFILHLEQNQTMQSHHSRCDYDLFRNLPIAGTIESTVVRGRFVVRNGQFMGGHGHWIREE